MLVIKEQTIGALVFFVEKGTTIDGVTVSATAYPDTSPVTNWTDNSLGCILEFKPESETEDEAYDCYVANRGWTKMKRTKTVADYLAFTTRALSEPVARLMFGSQVAIADGTPFVPYANLGDRNVEGWLRIQAQDSATPFADHCIMLVYGKLRLAEQPAWTKEQVKPKFKFEVLATSPNTAVADKITS